MSVCVLEKSHLYVCSMNIEFTPKAQNVTIVYQFAFKFKKILFGFLFIFKIVDLYTFTVIDNSDHYLKKKIDFISYY